MAQQALGAGMTVPRKRAMFGLLDADGWGWASVKAFVWLILIIFVLGYLPDRAYYFTVGRTVDLGVLVWAPINLCPPQNESLPCPPPVGAAIPWQTSPPELDLPAPRTDGAMIQVGTSILYIGGSDGSAAQANTFVAPVSGTGNFDAWSDGPALPAPRADAAVAYVAGRIVVIGGRDASGAPTDTVFRLSPDAEGNLGEWEELPALKLPEPIAGAAVAVGTSGLILVGGSNADGPIATTLRAPVAENGDLQAWSKEADLVAPQTDGTALFVGDFIWLVGGSDSGGPVNVIQRGSISPPADEGLPENPDEGKVVAWDASPSLPAARTNASSWTANGVIYVAGGSDADGTHDDVFWAVPDPAGDIPEWKQLEQSDLPPPGRGGAAPLVSGPTAILVGGQDAEGVKQDSLRSNLAPLSPFFALGLVGAIVPGLKIEGEIGQQLGYLNAAGVGTVFFVLLLLTALAFSFPDRTRAIFGRLFRRT